MGEQSNQTNQRKVEDQVKIIGLFAPGSLFFCTKISKMGGMYLVIIPSKYKEIVERYHNEKQSFYVMLIPTSEKCGRKRDGD